MEKIHDVQTPALYYVTSLAFDPKNRTLFYTTNNGKHWRDLNSVDLRTQQTRRLITNCRIGDLAYSRADSMLWGVQHHNGYSTIVRIAPPYDAWNTILPIMEFKYGTDVFDLDVSPDGKILTGSMLEINGAVKLVRFDTAELLRGQAGYSVLHEFTNTAPANFVFSADGTHLYGRRTRPGFRMCSSGASPTKPWVRHQRRHRLLRPIPMGDSLVVFSYTSKGFRPP
jgi:hypothetical protein